MPAKKVKVKEIVEEKKRYMECPFCHKKHYAHLGNDPTSAWCNKCGRRYSAVWKEED